MQPLIGYKMIDTYYRMINKAVYVRYVNNLTHKLSPHTQYVFAVVYAATKAYSGFIEIQSVPVNTEYEIFNSASEGYIQIYVFSNNRLDFQSTFRDSAECITVIYEYAPLTIT